jgi:hypothetical protein
MTGSMTKDIYGSWVGIQNEYCGGGTEVGLRMRIVMFDASEMCG